MALVVIMIKAIVMGYGLWILVRTIDMVLIMGSGYNYGYSHG